MLKLWVTQDYKEKSGLGYVTPDSCFDLDFEMENLESDFSKEVLRVCNGDTEVINYQTLLRPNGMYISPKEICSGAKNILCMKYIGNDYGYIYNMLWSGDNCNRYVAEICQEKDLEIFSSRIYFPFYRVGDIGFEVKIMETGKIVRSDDEFSDEVVKYDLWDRI